MREKRKQSWLKKRKKNFLLLTGQVDREPLELVADLVGQLARVADDDRADLPVDRVELLEDREHEDGRLAHAGFGLLSFSVGVEKRRR